MSKVIKAVNSMIENETLITKVRAGANPTELFFLFDNKHKWSMNHEPDEGFFLCYYPISVSIEGLAAIGDWSGLQGQYVTYHDEFSTREGLQSAKELYTILKEKVHGMSDVLDEIIKLSDIPF